MKHPPPSENTRNVSVKRFLSLVHCLCAVLLLHQDIRAQVTPTPPVAVPAAVKPIFWQQPLLFIPYQVNKNLPAVRDIAEVQLLLSRNGNGAWLVLQSAKPNVQGFSYHAPEDGQYWFALKHLDAKGQPLDGPHVIPQLHLVIDTKPPQLSLSADVEGPGDIAIRYEASDPNLNPQSLLIEARSEGGLWTNVNLGPPDVAQPERLNGVVHWPLPSSTGEVEIRASIADATGQRGQASTNVTLTGPALTMPTQAPAIPETSEPPKVAATRSPFAPTARDPFQSASKPAWEWPSNNQLPVVNNSVTTGPPPLLNPYVTAKENSTPRRTPAKFAVDGSEGMERAGPDNFAPESVGDCPHFVDSAGPHQELRNKMGTVPLPLPSTSDAEWSSAGSPADGPLLVNARTFDVEYELASVGPWGVGKIEIWGTPDGGNTWQSFGTDPDNRSPARITVPHGGTYGFRILVEGANSVGVTPPQSGDKPELVVSVDLNSPTTELIAVEPGEGDLTDHLRIRWQATDDNLEARPVGLFYSSYPNGPWTTIASGLENTGSYLWRIERHVPGRFYLRLEARDTAGNVASCQTPEPIELNRPQPTGTLRSIRPVTDVPSVGK